MTENQAIENKPTLCWKCLKEYPVEHIHSFEFGNLGYGSSFDSFGSRIQLCDKCYQESDPKIWDFNEIDTDNMYGGHYKYEDEIHAYVKNLPIQSRELFYNTCCFGADSNYMMGSQDWIDYELGILPYEKCKEYGMYAPEEIKAYNDRFPTCDKVFKKVYEGGSSACYCPYGASGNSDGTCGCDTSTECYLCTHYQPRKDSMKTINDLDEKILNERQRLNEMFIYAKSHLDLLNKNPSKYFSE